MFQRFGGIHIVAVFCLILLVWAGSSVGKEVTIVSCGWNSPDTVYLPRNAQTLKEAGDLRLILVLCAGSMNVELKLSKWYNLRGRSLHDSRFEELGGRDVKEEQWTSYAETR